MNYTPRPFEEIAQDLKNMRSTGVFERDQDLYTNMLMLFHAIQETLDRLTYERVPKVSPQSELTVNVRERSRDILDLPDLQE